MDASRAKILKAQSEKSAKQESAQVQIECKLGLQVRLHPFKNLALGLLALLWEA